MKNTVPVNDRAKIIYGNLTRRKLVLLAVLAAALHLTFLMDIMIGPAWLAIDDILAAFGKNAPDSSMHFILWSIRLPLAVMAVVVGASLGVAGAAMQTILSNPLASPYTLGISAAAGFGAALGLVLGVGVIPWAEELIVSGNAFLVALLASSIIYFVSWKKRAGTEIIVLLGIALLFLFNSLTAFLQYIATEQEVQTVVFWLFGSLTRATWLKAGITTVVLVLATILYLKDSWQLTALSLGDTKAKSLGVHVERLRLKVLIIASILTATAVCFVGTIGFIGLASPHIARMLVGEEQRFFLPASALGGALLLSAASIGSKLITPGAIFPIGIITSFIGVPFFVSLILRKSRR